MAALVALLVLFELFGSVAFAAEAARELEGVKKKIEQQRQGLSQAKKKEGSVLESLAKIDAELDIKTKDLKRVTATLQSVLADLERKENELKKIDVSLAARREWLKTRAAALYRWQRSGSAFVLLSGAETVGELMRRQHYLAATLAYDRSQIERLDSDSKQQKALAEELEEKRAAANEQKKKLTGIKEAIRVERQKKELMLASLRREKEGRQRALKELQQAALRLQKMLDELNRRSAGLPKQPPSGTAFEALKGKLDYPVSGQIAGGFGKTVHPEFSAELFRKGIDIDAPLGEEVRAVEAGKVVFADRFSGYGKMMIIDHGERYYTVYAHLAEIYKQPGDSVRRGEPIAQVGDSESLAGSRLYFEIRKDGKPLDPSAWFRK
jgi:murein hydrolase activator